MTPALLLNSGDQPFTRCTLQCFLPDVTWSCYSAEHIVHIDYIYMYMHSTHIGPMCTRRKWTHRLDQLVRTDCALAEWVLCLRDAFQLHSLQLIAIAIGLSETRDCATVDQLSAQHNSLSTSVLWQMHSDSSDSTESDLMQLSKWSNKFVVFLQPNLGNCNSCPFTKATSKFKLKDNWSAIMEFTISIMLALLCFLRNSSKRGGTAHC